MLPDRENSHRLQQATTWCQEGHRTLCHNPFHGHPTLPGEVTETSGQKLSIPTGDPASSHGQRSSAYPCILQAKAHLRRQIFGQYFGDILKERQRLFYMEWWHFWWTFIALNFEFILMNFNELLWILKCLLNVFDYYVLYWFCHEFWNVYWMSLNVLIFAMNFNWFTDWFNDLKDLINFIGLYCIVILLHYVCYGIEVWDNTG